MVMRVLVLGAGGPAGVNTCKALSGHDVIVYDQNPDHLVWAAPHALECYSAELSVETVNEIGADVVIPQPDNLTMWLADHQDQIEAQTFLPDRRTIALCQDKFEAGLAFRRAGLRNDCIELVDGHATFYEHLAPCWLRARHGAGAKAAIYARNELEFRHWHEFWRERDRTIEFVAERSLPGRDLAWSGIWYQGELVCSFTRQRLEYIYPGLTPEGLTGTPTIAEIIHDDAANELAEAACYAVDDMPHGIFSVDMREDEDGVPRPTEINAGRGFTTFGIWADQTDPNLMEIVVDGATGMIGDQNGQPHRDMLPEGMKLYRHIDCGAFIYTPVPA
jgi:carbamoyl-phosphate synthase large subunit